MQRTLITFALCLCLLPACHAEESSSTSVSSEADNAPAAPAAPAEVPAAPAPIAPVDAAAPVAPSPPSSSPGSPRAPAPPKAPSAPTKAEAAAAPAVEEAPAAPTVAPAEDLPTGPPSHQQWDELLRRYVSAAGKVDYTGLKKEKAALQQYLERLAAHPVEDSWSRREKMAYWINAYNAFTVKLIVDNYPVSSIRDLHQGNPWDVAWIKLGSRTYSLNAIENDILRPQFQDARIHFAVNCAAKSCPPLLNRAYTADRLEQQLEQQTRQFINNPAFNQLSGAKAAVSKIFEWYAKDFGNLREFLNRYADTQLSGTASIQYVEYDWALNN